jgi:hypothetical protein
MIEYYILSYSDGISDLYWSYGSPGRFTDDKKEARMYSMYKSAESAIRKIQLKRPDMLKENFKVEPVES